MGRNIFTDFNGNKENTIKLLNGIESAVGLFTVSSEIRFIHFNNAAEELLGYGPGQLLALTDQDPTAIFHPDFVDKLYAEIIAAMRQGQTFTYDCQMCCSDGTHKWVNISARLMQQSSGTLYYQSVFTPIKTPDNILLQGFHALIAMGDKAESSLLTELIEHYGGTCDVYNYGLDALDRFHDSADGFYQCAFIGCRMKDINGFELAKDIRHAVHPQASSLPLLLITDAADSENVQEAGDIGITAYIRKPVSPKKIRTWLKTLNK